MNRERAETHLRQLAEAELRGATTPGRRDSGHVGSLPLVAQALIAVGAVDVGTADEILAEFDLALAVREPGQGGAGGAGGAAPRRLARLTRVWSRRDVTGAFAASRQTAWRVVPVGQVIRIRDGAVRGELGLVSYLQTAHGGRFTVVGWMHGPAPERARHHPAPARGRRHDRGRLGVLPGSQAHARPVDPRRRRPLARHPLVGSEAAG
jgi:hypothetical protein